VSCHEFRQQDIGNARGRVIPGRRQLTEPLGEALNALLREGDGLSLRIARGAITIGEACRSQARSLKRSNSARAGDHPSGPPANIKAKLAESGEAGEGNAARLTP
jgi:hypothetical protein